MRTAAFVLGALLVIGASPAHAQLGALGKLKKGADKAVDAKQKYDDYNITDQEEGQREAARAFWRVPGCGGHEVRDARGRRAGPGQQASRPPMEVHRARHRRRE